MRRRSFIKKSLVLTLSSFVLPSALGNKINTYAATRNMSYPSYSPDPGRWRDDEINISWLGHATVLINFFGKIIITDPVLFERVGVNFLGTKIGPARMTAPALKPDDIPQPDLILLSHAHMDHMDIETLEFFTEKFPKKIDCITAYNTSDVIDDLDWKSLKEMDWDQELTWEGIHFKALEVKHFGWRYPWEKDRSKGFMHDGRSFNAYLLSYKNKQVLFGGDTAFSNKFEKYNLNNVDVAIMPIGAYNPWKINHCNPEEALIMADHQIKAKHFVPIHCNTFKQGSEPYHEPLNWLNRSASNYKLKVGLNDIGETFTIS